ncbi:MAG TPA: antibiotic biosynthesis monooxygenase [Jatrophihabitans sp.]|jgi:quinol monooxygenase YgiN|uniref:putative quinol monooxygenase n=1 Tax=Jatrophihabitans sp. TaxID=1932789 RepID=UPI002E0C3F26|nr:antibiotic biosynthesis monooxygenase [Jatrophihabitans sp.]
MTAVTTVTIITAKLGLGREVERQLAALASRTDGATGRTRYRSERALENPDVFVLTEHWDSTESVDSHVSDPELGWLLQTEHLHAAPPQVLYLESLPQHA